MQPLHTSSHTTFNPQEFSIASWVLKNKEPAGLGTKTLSASAWHYVPLTTQEKIIGVLALKPSNRNFATEEQRLLQSYVNILTIALTNQSQMAGSKLL